MAVQSCHACIEVARRSISPSEEHPHLVLIGVPDERRLDALRQTLEDHQVKHSCFYEPDQNNELTALATAPVASDIRHLFRKYQLLKL